MDFTQYDHYRAPSNIAESGATCFFCGHPFVADELIFDVNENEMGHAACGDAAIQDAQEAAMEEQREAA